MRRGSGYYSRSYAEDIRLVNTRLRRIMLAATVIVFLLMPRIISEQNLDLVNQAAIAVIGAIGLSVLTGYTGQLSFGQAGLFAAAGFVAGAASTLEGYPFIVALLLAMLTGAAVGIVLGLPALRLRGLYLVLATLAFHFIAILSVTRYQSYLNTTRALAGLTLTPPVIGPFTIETLTQWYYFLLILAAILLIFTINVLRTRPGRAWIAVRDRDLVAATMGINVSRYKLSAFVLSSVFASIAGVLLVYYNGVVSSQTYTIDLALNYLLMIIVGGLGSTTGAVLGPIFLVFTIRQIQNFAQTAPADISSYAIPAQQFFFGLIMVLFILFEPRGLIGIWRRIRLYFELWPFRYRPLAERRR